MSVSDIFQNFMMSIFKYKVEYCYISTKMAKNVKTLTNTGTDVNQPKVSYTAPGHVSWYNHFGKAFGITYKSGMNTYPVTANSFLTKSQQHFMPILPKRCEQDIIHRNQKMDIIRMPTISRMGVFLR